MRELIVVIIFLFIFWGFIIAYNRTDDIVVELDQKYHNSTDLRNGVIKYLKNKGKRCKSINGNTLIVNGSKYTLTETMVIVYGIPIQRVILKKSKANIRVLSNKTYSHISEGNTNRDFLS